MLLAEIMDTLRTSRDRVARKLIRKEADVEQWVVEPLLAALGWDLDERRELDCQARLRGGGFADWALRANGDIVAIIETKAPGTSLDAPAVQSQLAQRVGAQGVTYIIVTNGSEWWFYVPFAGQCLVDSRCLTIGIGSGPLQTVASQFSKLLGKEAVQSGRALKYARSLLAQQMMRWELPEICEELLAAAPSELVSVFHSLAKPKLRKEVGVSLPRDLVRRTLKELGSSKAAIGRLPIGRQSMKALGATADPPPFSRPILVTLAGEEIEVGTWKGVLVQVANWLLRRGRHLETKAMSSKAKPVVSGTPDEMTNPIALGHGQYIETNCSAKECMRRARWLLRKAQLDPAELRVMYVEPSAQQPLFQLSPEQK
ncbi:MAG: hypothetical protein ACYC63_00435 [Armatimonadota bacterium]